jgi:outer membrane receptor protein involved in Fe transport
VETVSVGLEPDGYEASAYAATRFQPVDAVTAEVGVRYDRISHTDDGDFAPRVLASFQPTPRTSVRASWGRYFQSHGIHELQVGDGQRGFYSSDKAETIALGIEHELDDDVTVRVEAYRRTIADQHPRYVNAMWRLEEFSEAEGDRLFIDPERGSARGIEFSVARPLGRHWAWSANYVLSVAEDKIDGKWVPRRTDQRHAIGVDAAYRPNDRWLLSWAWTIHSGWPSTATAFAFDTLADGSFQWRSTYDEYHGIRLPTYHRLDVRMTRTFQIGGGALQAYLDVFNIYGRKNVRSYDHWVSIYANGHIEVGRNPGQELLPMLPSIGVRYEF